MQYPLIFAILLATGVTAGPTQTSILLPGSQLDKTGSLEVNQLLAEPPPASGQKVTVHGIVTAVCRKKGSWLQLQTEAKAPIFRLEVNDGELVFPVSARGKTAYASGTLQVDSLTLQQTQDYLAYRAAEQGDPFDAALVQQPLTIYRLRPEAILIE